MAEYYSIRACKYCNNPFFTISQSQHHCSLECRFWDKVDIKDLDDCWEWQASKCPQGYGKINVSGMVIRAHRVVWELTYGPIPNNLCILHHCDNVSCVNPKHLFLGTQTDNINDRVSKNRSAKGENHGHSKLTDKDIIAIRFSLSKGETLSKIGQKFNTDTGNISRIKHRKGWAHVE